MNACNIPASAQPSITDDRRDSGYSSTQFPSPNGKLIESTRTQTTRSEANGKSRSVPSAPTPIAGFAEFDKSVDNTTISRFRHVHSLLEKPLLEYIRSTIRKKNCPISIRLMVLGRSEDDAKPCIVVLCPEQQSKKVRKFFDKKSVRALRLPEDGQPSFEVFVIGREPETKQAEGDIDVLIPIVDESDGYTNDTYCGAPIVIRQTSGVDKRCTFGGVIKASWSNGEIKLYGLTVGHVLLDYLEYDLTGSTESDESRCSDDWVFELSDSDSEDESYDSADEEEEEEEAEPLCIMNEVQLALPDASLPWAAGELSKIGSISKDSPRYRSAATDTLYDEPEAYYDWALIDMISYKPNLIRPRKMSHDEAQEGGVFNFRDNELVVSVSPPNSYGKRQPVVLVSGSEGLKRGYLSALPSRLLLGPGREFVDTLILNLGSNKQILDGDSGSWVVNETTLEVYGYVVAADAFGGGYIIPLAEAFRNIADTLKCQSIDLATTIDMASAKLGHMFDINGEPTAMIAPIIVDHSMMPSSSIISRISTPATNLSITSNISRVSTPATNFSITSIYDGALTLISSPEDDFFAQEKPLAHPKIDSNYNLEPARRPDIDDSHTEAPPEYESSDGGSNNTSRPGTPPVTEHPEDDTAVSSRPSRHVDYLSHDWKEEDIWSSWRYIVTRRAHFSNHVRLENASWRAWMKVKNNLRTVSAESINWLKDSDVTWLYGPLQLGVKPIHDTRAEISSNSLSKTDSRVSLNKKPILKKRSMSRITLQRPLSTASLLKQATATIQAQETQIILQPNNNRHEAVDDFSYPFTSRRMSDESSGLASPKASSGIASPTAERRQIRFNEQVEQCIAVDVSADDEDDMEAYPDCDGDNSDSDDGIVLKRIRTKKRTAKSESTEDKIIAKLPSTTLKDRKDTKHPLSPPLSPSATETMLPSKPSAEFFFDEDDDDEALLSPGWLSLPADSSSSKSTELRRTSSGMLTPYEEGDPNPDEGLYGRVIDKADTARRTTRVHWKRE